MSSDQETEPTSLEQSNLNSLELWDYTVELECLQGSQDLQLAAELGKTLLERNKELETGLRQHQNIIEDQTQEIEYLTKQTVALREVNDSRLRIYEQLEVSIQDLERANNRLALDHTADKKHIKSLCSNIETLEGKCEELQKKTEDVTSELDMYRKKAERKPESVEKTEKKEVLVTSKQPAKIEPTLKPVAERLNYSTPVKSIYVEPVIYSKEHEDLLKISDELRESKIAFAQEQRRVSELEEQLASMVQENNRLQDQMRELHQKDDEPKSMQEEFSILEEVRQGQLCIRCLRGVNDRAQDELSSLMDADDDDRSAISSLLLPPTHMENVSQEIRNQPHKYLHIQAEKEKALASVWSNSSAKDNPYRELVEKYEALLEVQLSQVNNIRKNKQLLGANAALINNNSGPMSLHEEIQTSGDFSQLSLKDGEEESGHFETNKIQEKGEKIETGNRKKLTQTPDFSEAETSSSGFSDETSNKGTQTDKERPGSFLCTIADGEDYCFSIYDDASPIDSRFRNRPEYRELFKEIFTILKKAAENKDEGEKLPLLDDSIPACGKVPPVTPANEEAPGNFTDDTQSVMSSVMSEQSIPLSDITIPEAPAPKEKEKPTPPPEKPAKEQNKENKVVENSKPKNNEPVAEPQRVLTPLLRQPLEYLAAGSPHLRKKSKNRNRKQSQDRQGADSPVFPSPPKITYQKSGGRKKRDYRPLESSPLTKVPLEPAAEWNGATMQFYNRSLNSPTPSVSAKPARTYQSWNPDTDTWDTKQCTASQEINKLRRLELSYAEVLRNADKNKGRRKKHQ